MFILGVKPNIILNSRKEWTMKISLKTYSGIFSASAPSGKSKGKHEVESYNKYGIRESYKLLKRFSKQIIHKNFTIKKVEDLSQLTELLEKFEKENGELGGNVTYVLETVFLKAAAKDKGRELFEFINDDVNNGLKPKMPMPVGNCIGGGLHSKKIHGKRPDFQEFLLIPDEKKFSKAVSTNLKAYFYARKILGAKKRNDENAWRTNKTNEEVLEILKKVSEKFGVRLGLDVASSTFYEKGYYNYKNKDLIRDRVDQIDYMIKLAKKYNLFYVEDPLDEDDFSGFAEIVDGVKKARKRTMIVGDDLTTTNPDLVKKAVRGNSINAMIIKPNQIGSILKVKQVVDYCKKHDVKMIFSHRSGETMDESLADLAVGFGANFIKTGIYGPERLIKLKRIIDIEKKIDK